jgi:hypothetical protein
VITTPEGLGLDKPIVVTMTLRQWNALAQTSRIGINLFDIDGGEQRIDEVTLQTAHEARENVDTAIKGAILGWTGD